MTKKVLLILICFMLFFPLKIKAARGCCSHHGGVSGCSSSGRQICQDGTLSPTCTCTPVVNYVYGCTDKTAKNYNINANKDNGTCEYYVYGCTDELAKNYNSDAEKDDGSCEFYKYGCMDIKAINYDETAEKDDNSCKYQNIVETTSSDNSNGILSFLTIGGIGTGIYYFKRKK